MNMMHLYVIIYRWYGYEYATGTSIYQPPCKVRMGNLICKACELVESAEGSSAGSVKSYEELAKAVGMYKTLMVTKNTVTGRRL